MYNTDVCGDDLDVYPRRLLKNEAYQKIKDFLFDDISERVYSERQLATALNLGLGSVRSAIERLRAENLIAVLPNSGIRVPELTAHSIIDFYEFRSIVEAHVVASLAGRLIQAQIAQVEAILANQEECVVRGRSQDYHDLDMQFHIALAEFHGNREIVRNLWQLRDKMYRLSSGLHRSHPERLGVNAKQHRAIWREICLGNGAKAMELLRTHLQWGQSCTLDPTMRGVRLDDRIGMVEWAGDPMSRDLRVAATSQASQTEGDR
jgi:DNA-binding GntR family transcriptional regulator